MSYIFRQAAWPRFHWNDAALAPLLAKTHYLMGRFAGRLERLGEPQRKQLLLEVLVQDVVATSRLAGAEVDEAAARVAAARELGMGGNDGDATEPSVAGLVSFLVDSRRHLDRPLSQERLWEWHRKLNPMAGGAVDPNGGAGAMVGGWRVRPKVVYIGDPSQGRVIFESPPHQRVPDEMRRFFTWLSEPAQIDPLIKASVALFWFSTILPFDDANGRIGRAIADRLVMLAGRAAERFFSHAALIYREVNGYHHTLRACQTGNMDITQWHRWYISSLTQAIQAAEPRLAAMIQSSAAAPAVSIRQGLTDRQFDGLNRLKAAGESQMSVAQWARLLGCSHDTALRDIKPLVAKGILVKNTAAGKKRSYTVVEG